MAQKWKVHKFGGTSVLNAERIRNVGQIIGESVPPSRKGVVVSAMKGVTDDLIETVDLAKSQNESYKALLKSIQDRHVRETSLLLEAPLKEQLLQIFEKDFSELSEILRGIWLLKNAGESIYERVSGMGEIWSAQIMNAHLQQKGFKTTWLDAREILVVKKTSQSVLINWEKSKEKIQAWLAKNEFDLITISGFVASNEDGIQTTLGRNGSDYSASIFGALLESDEIFIWTDVDGILSADPREIPEAIILDEMTYNEVTELAYFGAKVVHPSTMAPAIAHQIPVWIKNTLNPKAPGTKIHAQAKSNRAVKGFSSVHNLCLINIEGTGMVGVPGVAERVFASLRSSGVNVVLISQASSEQSICLAVSQSQCELARAAVENSFFAEIQKGQINPVQVTKDVSILAAVGDNMAHTPGVSGMFFTALGRSGINVRAIAQGSSERNISAVIDSKDSVRALRTVHSSFISPRQVVSIGLIGPGLIGSTFLKQLDEQTETLKQRNVEFQIRALADSKKMYLSENAIPLKNWKELLQSQSEPLNLEKMALHVRPSHIPHAVMIESTASNTLTPFYEKWLQQGLHIISPNKKANSTSMAEYRQIREAARKANRHFLYSTNVGAGLPILQTLRDLSATGDEIINVQGILSGTLSFIFNQFDGSQSFSEIVLKAKEAGYTEPDPREDLSGQDVVRKLVILAREAGQNIEVADVKVESLVPESLRSISRDEFLKRISEMDQLMAEKINAAKSQNQILRFVATFDKNQARVGLESLPAVHPFSKVSGTDNIVLFKTKRYLHQPLIVQGPGAGPEVTAAGVFADLLRLSQYLGALR